MPDLLTADGLAIYFSHKAGASNTQDLTVATRSSTGAAFGPAVDIAELDTDTGIEQTPGISADGSELYYVIQPTTGTRIVRSHRGPTRFEPAVPVDDIAAASANANDGDPQPLHDNLTIVFDSDRGGTGKLDLFIACE